MRGSNEETSMTLQLQYRDEDHNQSTIIHTGQLNWFKYAVNEMVTLVIPRGVSNGAAVSLCYQWTIHSNGTEKQSANVNATFRNVTTENNETKATFDNGYYTYELTMPENGGTSTIRMSNPVEKGDSTLISLTKDDWKARQISD
jgi:hypothetical protein